MISIYLIIYLIYILTRIIRLRRAIVSLRGTDGVPLCQACLRHTHAAEHFHCKIKDISSHKL
jgi:hypothetical protein